MGSDYFVFYTEASIVCIVILSMMLLNDRLHSTLRETQVWFNRTVIAHILYFLSDACWAAVLSGQLPGTRTLVASINLANYVLMSLMAYEWFMFIAASEKMPFRTSRKKRALCLLPMVVSLLILVTSYAAEPYFWISETGELNRLYDTMLIAAPVIYLLTAFIISTINARKAESREEKKADWLLGSYPLGVIAFGLIQLLFLNAPVFCFGSTLMLLFFYIQHMQALISIDQLTRLNNRGQINRYMEQVHYRENARVFVMMMDIDRFKQINDTYGHAEGDRALILFSEVLKQTCGAIKAPVFLGRYGGDEFTVILQNPGENESPEQTVLALRAALAEKRRENRLPYALEVSAGYDELRDGDDTMQACLIRADEMLYKEKCAKGTARR